MERKLKLIGWLVAGALTVSPTMADARPGDENHGVRDQAWEDEREERKSKIGTESGDDVVHILQGAEADSPWNMRIELETGRFTLTSAHSDVGYVAFGQCSSRLLK